MDSAGNHEYAYYGFLLLGKTFDEIINNRDNMALVFEMVGVPEFITNYIDNRRKGGDILDMRLFFPGGKEEMNRDLLATVRRLIIGPLPHRIILKSYELKTNHEMSREMLSVVHFLNKHREIYLKHIDIIEEVDSSFVPVDDKWFIPSDGHMPLIIDGKITVRFKSTTSDKTVKEGEITTSIKMRSFVIEISSWALTSIELMDFVDKAAIEMDESFEQILNAEYYYYAHVAPDRFSRYDMPPSNKTWKNIFFEGADEIQSAVEQFIKSDGISNANAHHLGIGIFGQPGNGKSSTIKAILNQCQTLGQTRQAVVVNFNFIENIEQLYNIFYGDMLTSHTKLPQGKRIYVFEDFDTSPFANRSQHMKLEAGDIRPLLHDGIPDHVKNIMNDAINKTLESSVGINIGDLLNVLDGIVEAPGRIVIMTSNHPENIDPAMLRPGRIDIRVDLKGSRRIDIINIVENYFNVSAVKLPDIVGDYALSGAMVMGICRTSKTAKTAIKRITQKMIST